MFAKKRSMRNNKNCELKYVMQSLKEQVILFNNLESNLHLENTRKVHDEN